MTLSGLGEAVTVLTGTPVMDPDSGEMTGTSWDAPTEVTVADVLCEPRPSAEPVQDARNAVISGWTLYMPAGAVVTARHRVRVRGLVHQVMGEPADWRLGTWRPGLVVQTQRVEG